MNRYAIFHHPGRAKPWRVVTQSRLAFIIWLEMSGYDYETEEEAIKDWRRDVKRETDRRFKNGRRVTDWAP